MNESKFNFAYVFSVVILLIFAYITFLGLAYWTGGSLTTPILLTVLLVIVVAGCVFVMSMSKSTRWTDLGLIGQICFGVIVLAALLCATIPFTNFLRVVKEKDQLKTMMVDAATTAGEMDEAYTKYAQKRISDYKNNLRSIANLKSTNRAAYDEAFGQAAGADDSQKINALAESLQAKLLPLDAQQIVNERHEWLDKAKDLNVWNPMTASNINKLKDQMNTWSENYQQLSSVTYKGEKELKFEYNEFDSKLNQLTDSYQEFRKPSGVAIIVAIVCFLIMLLPYFLAQGSLAATKSGGNNASIYE